jgi:serine/threonine-protein kinase
MADHFAALARAQIEDAPPRASERNPELPRALDPVLARGLAKRPEDRYRTGRELVAAIDDALAATAPRRETAMLTSPRTTAAAPAMNVYGGRRSGRPAPPRPSRARGRVVAALLAAAAIAVAAVALSSQSGPSHPASAAHQQTAAKGGRHGSSAPTGSTAVSAAPSESAPSESAPSGSTTAAGSADQLETRGHQLMMAGEYGSAIPVLRQAVSASPRGSLTYAYALYDLGRSLLLAGDPQAAIPILRERLAIPNQTTVVAATLDAALRSARNNGQGGD